MPKIKYLSWFRDSQNINQERNRSIQKIKNRQHPEKSRQSFNPFNQGSDNHKPPRRSARMRGRKKPTTLEPCRSEIRPIAVDTPQ